MSQKQLKQEEKAVKSEFTESVISNLETLKTIGDSYRRKIYKIDDITSYFITNMKLKSANMGEKYINDMVTNINKIFNNVSRQSKYDIVEFVNSVMQYGYKMISYKYTKNKIEPKLPDYTMAEIKDLAS